MNRTHKTPTGTGYFTVPHAACRHVSTWSLDHFARALQTAHITPHIVAHAVAHAVAYAVAVSWAAKAR